ncbi:BatD family protein [Tolumonas osonensis]|uniref:DUF7939 domain-containing protein n=1 Tax=Tolumonas osonensis TaxID=675874 RepID=A0A841GB50_9GAMM|nr:hypothetical protein [Tolumonas osonensis]
MKLPYSGLCGLALIWCTSGSAVQLTGQVDSQTLSLGDNLTYTVTADEHLADDALDIRPLFRDFIIGNIQVTHASATETSWVIPLQPVITGDITIPGLSVPNAESAPVTISVSGDAQETNYETPAPEASPEMETQAPAHLIESQIGAESAYRGELITYSVKVAKRADPENRPPVLSSAQESKIIPVGEPTEDKEIFADHYQETVTYHYIIIPDNTGSLKIPAATLASDAAQMSDEHIIAIKPIPTAFQGTEKEWLPSAGITIEDRWEPQTSYVKPGQPLTRVITLTGINNSQEQLPDLDLPVINDVRVYSDGQKNEQEYQNGMLISRKTFRQVFVPEKNNAFTAPAVHLNWWNAISDRAQVVSLSERKFLASIATENLKEKAVVPAPVKKEQSIISYLIPLLQKVLMAFGLLIALLTPILAITWYYKEALRARYECYKLWQGLQHACSVNDAMTAYQMLLFWASHRWKQAFTGIEQLPFYSHLKNELDELQAACFSGCEMTWNGRKLIKKLRRTRVIKTVTPVSENQFDEFSY